MTLSGAQRLLIVDDEPGFRDLVHEVAAELGIEVLAVHSAPAFRDQFDRFNPTVVCLDIEMPQENGLELVKWIGGKPSHPAVILMSGTTDLLDAALALAAASNLKIAASLEKPQRLAKLRQALRDASGVRA